MKGIDQFLRMGKVGSGLPAIMPRIVTFPFDKVLVLVTILAAIEYGFDFIFKLVIDRDGLWRRRGVAIDFIAMPWGETVNMEDWVLVHTWW
jgi:hypothetical protein